MSEKEPLEENLQQEFLRIGKNIKGLVDSFFSSEELKNFSRDVQTEFSELIDVFDDTANEFKESELGQQIRSDIEDLRERIKNGEFQSKMKSEVSNLLKIINEELEKGKDSFTSREDE